MRDILIKYLTHIFVIETMAARSFILIQRDLADKKTITPYLSGRCLESAGEESRHAEMIATMIRRLTPIKRPAMRKIAVRQITVMVEPHEMDTRAYRLLRFLTFAETHFVESGLNTFDHNVRKAAAKLNIPDLAKDADRFYETVSLDEKRHVDLDVQLSTHYHKHFPDMTAAVDAECLPVGSTILGKAYAIRNRLEKALDDDRKN